MNLNESGSAKKSVLAGPQNKPLLITNLVFIFLIVVCVAIWLFASIQTILEHVESLGLNSIR